MQNEFVKVQKNGHKGRLHRTTWERIGRENNKEGWILDVSEPEEVLAIREKKIVYQSGQELSNQNETVTAEKSEVKEEEIIKTKKTAKK